MNPIDNVCPACAKVCKNSRGLAIHQRSCASAPPPSGEPGPAQTRKRSFASIAAEWAVKEVQARIAHAQGILDLEVRKADLEVRKADLEVRKADDATMRFREKEARLAEESRAKLALEAEDSRAKLALEAEHSRGKLAILAEAEARMAEESRGRISLMDARETQTRVQTRLLTARDAQLRMYGGAKHAFFSMEDIAEVMMPFGAAVTLAIRGGGTTILNEGREVLALHVDLARDITQYVQATYPDRPLLEKTFYTGDVSTLISHTVANPATDALLAAVESAPPAVAARVKGVMRALLGDPGGVPVAVRGACEAVLKEHFRVQRATLAELASRVTAPRLANAVEAIRASGNLSAHSSSAPDPIGDSVLLAHLVAVLHGFRPRALLTGPAG